MLKLENLVLRQVLVELSQEVCGNPDAASDALNKMSNAEFLQKLSWALETLLESQGE